GFYSRTVYWGLQAIAAINWTSGEEAVFCNTLLREGKIILATTGTSRPWVGYMSPLLLFIGFTALLTTFADVFYEHYGWLLFTGLVSITLGLILQNRRTPEPLQPVSVTKPRTIWWLWVIGYLTSIVVLPRVDWHGPWLVVLFLFVAIIAALSSAVSVHRQQAIREQYCRNNETSA